MKRSKVLALAGVSLLSAAVLAACGGGSGSSSKSTEAPSVHSYVYTTDPETLDYVIANKQSTSDVVANLVDGLLEYDEFNNLVPSLAEDWSVSADGLTYTYTLREDAKWFTADGEEYATITAEDFVTGLKHAADKQSEALYLVQDSIAGLKDYVDGKEKDFSKVGIKAVDERTVEYTLLQPEAFWNSKVTMGILFPVNAEFLASQGDDYGSPKADSILYSGPYLLTALTAKSSVEFAKNPEYWDADKVKIDEVKYTYYDGSDPESLARNFLEGNYTVARLFPNTPSYPKIKEEHGDNITFSPQGDSTQFLLPNLNRITYNHTTKKDDSEKQSTQKALRNKDFRQALSFAINRESMMAQNVGQDAAINTVRSYHVPTEFVTADGKSFGQLANDKLSAFGDEWNKLDLTDQSTDAFNADIAKAEFAKAKKALEADGVKFPIQLDMMTDSAAEVTGQMFASMKESIESTLGADNVVINIHKVSSDEVDNATYFATNPDQADYDISIGGWSPDYVDPSTYLDIFKSVGSPYAVRYGFSAEESDAEAVKAVEWDKYDALVEAAGKETEPAKRYEKYAEAQAWLVDSGLSIPLYSSGGVPRLSQLVPFKISTIHLGLKGDVSFKRNELQAEPVTKKQYDEAKAKYDEAKAKSNADYQESLKDHVK